VCTSKAELCDESYLLSDSSVESVSSSEEILVMGMLPVVVIGPLVRPLCLSQPYASPSATAMQRQEIYHLPQGFVT
jgi:hypothetical protein